MRHSNSAMNAKADRLKIGFVFDDSLDKPDGVQQYILSVGSWLSAQGHEVHYLVGNTERKDLPNVHSLSRNVAVSFNGNDMTIPLPTSRRMLREFLKDQAFDLLHVQVPYSPWLAGRLIAAADSHTAVMGTFHIVAISPLVTTASRLLGLYTHTTVRRFDEIVSVSSAAQQFARSTYGVITDVVPNAFEYQRFHDAQPMQCDDDRLTILFLGRLVTRKGCQILLEAVQQLRAKHGDAMFRVLICGKGPELARLQQFVDTYELSNVVTFVGFVSELDKPSYYASADIAVFPSSGGESFGIVLVEAMASGRTAVIGGDNVGYRSVLQPQPDLLFNPHESAALATKLEYLLTNSKARNDAAAWGTAYATQFDEAVVGAELLRRYAAALHKRRQTAIIEA